MDRLEDGRVVWVCGERGEVLRPDVAVGRGQYADAGIEVRGAVDDVLDLSASIKYRSSRVREDADASRTYCSSSAVLRIRPFCAASRRQNRPLRSTMTCPVSPRSPAFAYEVLQSRPSGPGIRQQSNIHLRPRQFDRTARNGASAYRNVSMQNGASLDPSGLTCPSLSCCLNSMVARVMLAARWTAVCGR